MLSLKKKSARLPIIPFKTGEAFFQHWCDWGNNRLMEDEPVPAIVLDAREFAGTRDAVKTKADGNQSALIRVAADDGGFEVIAETAGPGAVLSPGDVVMWVPGKYLAELADQFPDSRGAWVGLIVAKVANELNVNTNELRVTAWYRDAR